MPYYGASRRPLQSPSVWLPAPAQPALPYTSLAPPPDGGQPEPACGTPVLVDHQRASAFAPPGSNRFAHTGAPDGQPLRYDQNPRLQHAAHTGGLALHNLLVLGHVETLYFERWSDRFRLRSGGQHRTGTIAVDGELISVFNPRWDAAELCNAVRARTRGFDSPHVHLAINPVFAVVYLGFQDPGGGLPLKCR